MSMPELLPCPFCGSNRVGAFARTCDWNTPYNPADRAYPVVRCECGIEVPGENWGEPPTAIEKWNRRAALQEDVPREHLIKVMGESDCWRQKFYAMRREVRRVNKAVELYSKVVQLQASRASFRMVQVAAMQSSESKEGT